MLTNEQEERADSAKYQEQEGRQELQIIFSLVPAHPLTVPTWSMDRGSLALFSCMLGLQTPCSQYLQHAVLVIPMQTACRMSPAKSLQVSVLSVLQQHLVKLVLVLGVERKGQSITSHGRPASNLKKATLIILRHQVAQYCAVIDKSIKRSKNQTIVKKIMRDKTNSPFLYSFYSSF